MYKNDNRNLCAFMQNCWHTLTDTVSKNSAKAFSSSSVLRAVATNHRLWHSNFLFVGYTAVWWEFLFVYQVSVNKLPAITNACFVSLLISELQQTFCNHKKTAYTAQINHAKTSHRGFILPPGLLYLLNVQIVVLRTDAMPGILGDMP